MIQCFSICHLEYNSSLCSVMSGALKLEANTFLIVGQERGIRSTNFQSNLFYPYLRLGMLRSFSRPSWMDMGVTLYCFETLNERTSRVPRAQPSDLDPFASFLQPRVLSWNPKQIHLLILVWARRRKPFRSN